MQGRRNPFVAREGIPWLMVTLLAAITVWNYFGTAYASILIIPFTYLFLVFRDPRRVIPAVALGVISPVDGTIVEIGLSDKGVLGGDVHKIIIAVDSFGTYTARCPVEGKIMDFRGDAPDDSVRKFSAGLWVRTDEDDDVVLQFQGHRFGLAPLAFLRYGERVGQGQRCAYLRLTRFAEVQFPIHGRILVEKGQRVRAGADLLGKLPPS